jgi:methyl-accepting chemotaxis protein
VIGYINSSLIWFFTGIPGVGENLAFLLFLALLGVAATLIVKNYAQHHRPMMLALRRRLAVLDNVLKGEQVDECQAAFASRFGEVDEVMREGGRQTHDLQRAWAEYKETIVEPNESPIRNTSRPEGFFLHLSDGARGLNWWANIFVALGLVITFLGIVAALAAATSALGSSADPTVMQRSLVTLLSVTAAKFWTSVGGVAGSILLRAFDRRWKVQVERDLARLSDQLEHGMQFLPPQSIAASQLVEAKEQTTATKTLATELAAAIRENFTTAIEPMATQLGRIHTSMEEFRSGGFNQIGKELGDALSKNAGREMEALAQSLTDMTEKLSGVSANLEGSGAAANQQIESAARQFSEASEQMNRAFETLNSRIEEVGGRLNKEAEDAAQRTAGQFAEVQELNRKTAEENREVLLSMGADMRAQSTAASREMVEAIRDAVTSAMAEGNEATRRALEQFGSANDTIQAAFERMQQRIVEQGERMTAGAGEAADRNAEVLARAAAALERATARAAEGMTGAIDEAVSRAAAAGAEALASAFAGFNQRFEAASAGLVETLRTTSSRMEAVASSIERSTRASDDHTSRLSEASERARGMATALGQAASDVQAATAPIREATSSIGTSLATTRELMETQSRVAEANRADLERLSGRLAETTAAATQAWSEYRARFADVDRALGEALEKIASASSEHADHLNAHVGRIDDALGTAVGRLSASIEPLKEMAENVEDVLGRIRQGA